MSRIAPLLLAGYGAGLFATYASPLALALGGLTVLLAIGLAQTGIDVTTRIGGGPTLRLSRVPGTAANALRIAPLGLVAGGLTGFVSLTGSGTLIATVLTVAASGTLASLNPRLA